MLSSSIEKRYRSQMAQPESNEKEQRSLEGVTLQNDAVPVFVYYRDPTFDLVFTLINCFVFTYYILNTKRPSTVAVNIAGYLLFLALITYIVFERTDFWFGQSLTSLVLLAIALFSFRLLIFCFRLLWSRWIGKAL